SDKAEAVEIDRHPAARAERLEGEAGVVRRVPRDHSIAVPDQFFHLFDEHFAGAGGIASKIHSSANLQEPDREPSAKPGRRVVDDHGDHERIPGSPVWAGSEKAGLTASGGGSGGSR